MDSAKVILTTEDPNLNEVLSITEAIGTEGQLDHKQNLRLRLLAEELVGMLRGIAGDVSAVYKLERLGKKYLLSLTSDVTMTRSMREQLIFASKTGKNSVALGFMGKIKEMIAVALLPDDEDISPIEGLSLGLMGMSSPGGAVETGALPNVSQWSMDSYKEALNSESISKEESREAWDELERSITASIADDVRVSVTGSHVEIVIEKDFSKDE